MYKTSRTGKKVHIADVSVFNFKIATQEDVEKSNRESPLNPAMGDFELDNFDEGESARIAFLF